MRVDSQEFARTFGNGVAAADRSDVLLNDLPAAQEALWEMLVRKALQLLPLGLVDLPRIRELRRKYTDRPMDLADAALIRIAEREGIAKYSPWTRETSLPTGFMVGSVRQSFRDPAIIIATGCGDFFVYCRGHFTTTVTRIQGWMQH